VARRVQVTVLGKSPSWQDAGGACSGYLVQDAGLTLLLDCGNGVFGKLRATSDYRDVDAVVLSHLHADHFLDLVPFAYALTYGPGAEERGAARPALHAPPGARDAFRRVCGTWGPETLIEDAFELREYAIDAELAIEPLVIRFASVPHYTATQAVSIADRRGRRFTFGADSAPSDALVEFASGSSLLMLEATLTEPEAEGPRGHLTATEAGEHARRAGAERLVLTHLTDEMDVEAARAHAEAAFGADVSVAAEGDRYEV
jgi:ribonuclease BN (tRNA processing enzyme)